MMKPKVLVIDDGVDSWHLLSTALKSHDYYPVWAADGMQAISAARHQQPEAILLDLGLPGGDGFYVLERLKSNTMLSAIPVIVVTGRDRKEAEERAQRLGAAGYVQKPINVDELITSLQQVLARQS
ncbi:MAG TPA: response regulator [Nitrospiraceae bacterium]|nr:response regulator [Nitrospiraceae bacterium]